MNRSVILTCVLFGCLLGWLLSGSPVPLFLSLVVLAGFGVARIFRIDGSEILPLFLTIPLVIIQWWLFSTGRAMALLADPPVVFHAGMGLLWWSIVIVFRRDDQSHRPGNRLFWSALGGTALLLCSAGVTEIFRGTPFLTRCVAATPLVLVLWAEWLQGRRFRWRSILTATSFVAALGILTTLSNLLATQLYATFRSTDFDDDSDSFAEYSSPGDTADSSESSARKLPLRTDIHFNNRIRFYLQMDSRSDFQRLIASPLYLRSTTVSIFDSDDEMSPTRVGAWIYDSDDNVVDTWTRISPIDSGRPAMYSVLVDAADHEQVPLLHQTYRVAADAVYEYADGWYHVSPPGDALWVRIRAEASLDPVPRRLEPATGRVIAPYVNLPLTDLAARIRRLSDKLTEGASREDIPEIIRQYLATSTTYSLRYRNPEGLSPIENFLFHEKRGHCELYAASTAMLLRASGIPARVSYGYAGGQADPSSLTIAYRDSDFHAWPEILTENRGWQIFDTTPQSEFAASRLSQPAGKMEVNFSRYEDLAGLEGLNEGDGIFAILLDGILLHGSNYFPYLLGLIALAGAALLAGRAWLRKRTDAAIDAGLLPELSRKTTATFRPAFAEAILDLGESYGYRRSPGQTLREYVEQLLREGVGGDIMRTATDYLYRVRFARADRDNKLEKHFLREIRSLQ